MKYIVFGVIIAFPLAGLILSIALRNHPRIKGFLTAFAALGVLLLFAVPFTGLSVVIIHQSMHKHDWLSVLFALPFLTVGLAFFSGIFLGTPTLLQQAHRRAELPDQPWLWDHDWASGLVPADGARVALGAWLFALVWNGISWCAVIGAYERSPNVHIPLPVAMIFPAIGLAMLAWAVAATLQRLRFGKCTLRLHTLPASPGGALSGVVQIDRAIVPAGPTRLRLSCTEFTRSGKNSQQRLIYEDEQQLDALPHAARGTEVPVYFNLPQQCSCTSTDGFRSIDWRLEARVPTAGMTCRSRYRVPVFQTTAQVHAPDIAAPYRHHDTIADPVQLPGVSITRLAGNGRVFHFAAGRNVASAAMLTAASLLLNVGALFLLQSKSTLGGGIVFTLIAVVFDMLTVNAWLSSTTLTIRPGRLLRDAGLPLMHFQRTYSIDEIEDIGCEIAGQTFSTTMYAVYLLIDGSRKRLVSNIPGRLNAERVCAQISDSVGFEPEATASQTA